MKRFLYFFAVTAIVALAAGCTKETPEDNQGQTPPEADELSAPTVSATVSDEAIAFSWTTGTIEDSALEVQYTLYVGKEGDDLFEKGESFQTGSECTYSISGEAYTDLLISFGCVSGGSVNLAAIVTAAADGKSKTSAEYRFSASLPEPEVVMPTALYMKGGACEGGWDTAVVINPVAEGVYEVSDVALRFGVPEDGKGFKFFTGEEAYPFYGQDKTEGAAFGDVKIFLSENDGDSQFYPLLYDYVSGVYTINVDLNTMKLTMTKTGDVDEFIPSSMIYILGDYMDYGWKMEQGNALAPVEENVFEGYDIHLTKESRFKFDDINWTEWTRDDTASDYWTLRSKLEDDDCRFVPSEADPDFQNGKYTVRVDFNTKKVSLTLTEADPSYPTALYIVGPATTAEWDITAAIPMTMVSAGIFKAENVQLNVGAAVEGDPKGNGFKFAINNDWSTGYGSKANFDNGETGWELEQCDRQFYPLLMGLSSGTYTITADFTTMMVKVE